jgi:hypothetical protein
MQAGSYLGVEAAELAAALRIIQTRWLLLLLLLLLLRLTCHRQKRMCTTLPAAAPGRISELAPMINFGNRPCCVGWIVCCASWAAAPL